MTKKSQTADAIRNPLPTTTPPSISKAQAKSLVGNISKSSPTLFKNVVLMVEKQAHRVLGFDTAQDCLIKEVPELSNSYVRLLLRAAAIYIELDCNLMYLDNVTESVFRPLHGAKMTYAKAVWDKALVRLNSQAFLPIKAGHIRQAMAELDSVIATGEIETQESLQWSLKPSAFSVDDVVQRRIKHDAKRIAKTLMLPHVKTKAEWVEVAHLIHQQLIAACPIPEQLPLKTTAIK